MPSSRGRRAAERRAAVRRRQRATVAVLLALAVLGLAAALVARDGDRADRRPGVDAVRTGSKAVAAARPVEVGRREPAAYTVAYRVETYSRGDRVTTRDEVTVERPFRGRTVKRAGEDRSSPVRSEQFAELGLLFVPHSGAAEAVRLEVGPSIAPSDLRVAPVLDDLLGDGRAVEREEREVLGRRCQVLRFGGPVTAGTVSPAPPSDETSRPMTGEYADACFDEAGLLLEELWVIDGAVQRYRVAVEVDDRTREGSTRGASVDVPDIPPGEPVPVAEGGGSFRPVDPTSAYDAPFFVLDEHPLPLYEGRWAVVSPASGDRTDEDVAARQLGYVADVWRDGIDVIVVEQGSTNGGVKPFEFARGPRIEVADLGEGEFVADLRTSEIRFRRPGGYFVKVRGTAGRDRLEQIAGQLRSTPGGDGLRYLDDVAT